MKRRSLSAEVRHMTGCLAVCIAPWAYVLGFSDLRGFLLAMAAGLTLLISTYQPKPKPPA